MRKLALILTLLVLPSLLFAHSNGHDGGFMSGLNHPVLGLDHLLAMLCVGVLSAQIGGRALWTVPATFIFIMLIGGVLGMNNIELLSVEQGIALSVFALGIALAVEKKLSTVVAMVFVGFFAIFHGHAHGTEMPSLAQPYFYAAGFLLGSAFIHIAGVLIGVGAKKSDSMQLLRYVGAGIAGVGFHLIVS